MTSRTSKTNSAYLHGGKRNRAIVLIGVCGVLSSCLLYMILRREEDKRISEEFSHRSTDSMMSIGSEFESGIAMVRSVSAFMQSCPEATQEQFSIFAKSLLSRDTAIHALSWNPRLSVNELAGHELSAKARYPDYRLTEMRNGVSQDVNLDAASEYGSRDFVIVDFIEPLDSNWSALGFDIASEPTRREALDRARATGKLTSTGIIKLVQESEEQSGILVLGPIYEKDVELRTAEQRWNHLKGIVVGVYRIGATIEAALDSLRPTGIDVYVFDESRSNGRHQPIHVHSSMLRADTAAPVADMTSFKTRALIETMVIEVGGRPWTLCCVPMANYVAIRRTWLPFWALGGGLLGTLTLIGYFSSLRRMTDRLRHHLTQRNEAELTLRITQRSIDSSHIPVLWVRPDGRFCYANHAAAASLGYEAKELQGMRVPDIDPNWPADEWRGRWEQLKQSRTAKFESLHRRRDGTTFPVEIMANYFSYSNEEYMYCLALDITERKLQQERTREREQELAHVSRLSTLGEMVAGIAHEINQPLSAISNYADACSCVLTASKGEHPMEEWTEEIGRQAVRCGDIIRRLRNFVKKNSSERNRVSLNEVVDDAVALLNPDIRHTPISTRWVHMESKSEVIANKVELQQVVVNLLRNAYEAVGKSGPADPQVRVHGHASGGIVELTVEDHGYGIENEHVARIFDAFYTTKADGLGMGLAISRSIIEAHGGRLWAEPRTPCGAKFHVELPLAGEGTHVS